MAIDLDLKGARNQREIEERIKAELLRLPLDLRKTTLERVAVDVLVDSVGTPQRPVRATTSPTPPAPAPAGDAAEDQPHWMRIRDWCQAHPSPDGTYRNVDIARAVYPDRYRAGGNARNVIVATVYSSTLRRSPRHSERPDFVLLGRGRFRLATEQDRTRTGTARTRGGATQAS